MREVKREGVLFESTPGDPLYDALFNREALLNHLQRYGLEPPNCEPYLIFRRSYDLLFAQSKSRDDLYFDFSWALFTMYVNASPNKLMGAAVWKDFVGRRDRHPINYLLDQAYAQGLIE